MEGSVAYISLPFPNIFEEHSGLHDIPWSVLNDRNKKIVRGWRKSTVRSTIHFPHHLPLIPVVVVAGVVCEAAAAAVCLAAGCAGWPAAAGCLRWTAVIAAAAADHFAGWSADHSGPAEWSARDSLNIQSVICNVLTQWSMTNIYSKSQTLKLLSYTPSKFHS